VSKRVKINFEIINKGKYQLIPSKEIAESRQRIAGNMRNFIRRLITKSGIH
jgi:hypothetical protein